MIALLTRNGSNPKYVGYIVVAVVIFYAVQWGGPPHFKGSNVGGSPGVTGVRCSGRVMAIVRLFSSVLQVRMVACM